MKRLVAAFVFSALPACATVQSGAFEIPASFAEREFPKLKSRASFDLDCAADQLTITTLNVYATPGGNHPSEVGVKGCGRKAVYLPKDGVWLMNGGATRTFEEAPAVAATGAPAARPTPPPAP